MATSWNRIARRIRVPLGFAFAVLFLWLARPTLLFLTLSLALVVPGLLLRGYASGYVKKNTELTVAGPYAHTRNPLYLGSILIAFGFALAARSFWIAMVVVLLFAAIYVPGNSLGGGVSAFGVSGVRRVCSLGAQALAEDGCGRRIRSHQRGIFVGTLSKAS